MDERKKMTIQLLIVDDDTAFRRVLIKELSRQGFAADGAANGEEALQLLEHHSYHVVLLDMRMPGMDGMEALTQIKRISPSTEIILLTAFATLGEAVESTKRGAFHYLMKPAQLDEMESLIHRAYEKGKLEAQNLALREQIERGKQFADLIGESPKFLEIKAMIKRVGPTEATVLLQGESGVGKELVAGAIHASSNRHQEPFIIVDCNTFQETLVESELFGHERGAYTGATTQKRGLFETAQGGTLFIDEIGDANSAIQARLLRMLETGEFRRVGGVRTLAADVRIITATNQNLDRLVSEGKFRSDLYHRLNVVMISLPPLRKRMEDIPLLARHFLAQFTRKQRRTITLSPEALEALIRYEWPGNVRELRNVLERAVILCDSDNITVHDLPPNLTNAVPASFQPNQLVSLEEVETQYIQWVLQQVGGKRNQAAEVLKIDSKTLYRKLKQQDGPVD